VENNQDIGIFHEISFKAVIRNNVVRHNGKGHRGWFWRAEIGVAASQDVEVNNNTLTIAAGGCGIVLIDQGRRTKNGGKYKTRNNTVHDNDSTFEGAACAGGVSDVVGRRPVLLVALGGLMASTALFLLAGSVEWLFVARGVQGLATGAALSAASAALLDLHPRPAPAGVGLTHATVAVGGIGLGMLVSSSLVQIGWEPRLLPYLVLLVLVATAFAGAYWMPETVVERSRFRLTVAPPASRRSSAGPSSSRLWRCSPPGRSARSSSRSVRNSPRSCSTRAT